MVYIVIILNKIKISHPHWSRKSIGGCYGFVGCERDQYPNHILEVPGGLVVWVP